MKAILLDGSHENDATGERVRAALKMELQTQGWDVEEVIVRDKKIGNCAGDFFCWTRDPGICNLNDDNRVIARSIARSDLMVYLTPVTFGGYSSALKRMVDHQIQNISPFFAKVAGETHHQPRYEKYPDFLAVGWMDAPDAQAEAVFQYLASRNAINFYANTAVTGVVCANQTDEELCRQARNWLSDLHKGQSSKTVALSEHRETELGVGPIRRALLLVGSPRTRKSTSQSLGGYLMEQLGARNIETETFYIHTSLNSPARMNSLLDAAAAVDLVMLAFPLYVDSLPAPTIATLERIAAHRAGLESTRRQLFAAISNNGFPEAHHNASALAICETFAQQTGFGWAGGLALGAGEGLVHGAPLNGAGGQAVQIKKALELAAVALANGKRIPKDAVDLMAKPVIPTWLYRLVGGYGWGRQAKKYGMEKLLRRQPYQAALDQSS